MRIALLLLTAATMVAAGCSNPNTVPSHSASEDKAINDLKKMSPQDRIALIEKGPMPASAKEAEIKKIKDENGLK